MPIKNPNPFVSTVERLNSGVNPYVARLMLGSATGSLPIYYGEDLRVRAGTWRAHLSARAGRSLSRLIVEIGCHKGSTLLALANAFPDAACVGIDVTYKRVVTTAERARDRQLANVGVIMANATAFDALFAPCEVDGVLIFFPDPWIKKARQAKHRLVNGAFVRRLQTALTKGGFVWLKTDQGLYYDMAAAEFAEAGLLPDTTLPLGQDFDSAFERRYRALGAAICQGAFSNRSISSPAR